MERLDRELRAHLEAAPPGAGVERVAAVWPDAVGELVARHAWPARLGRDGTLHVAAGSSTWAFELAQLAPTILVRLRERLGPAAPAALRFALGPVPEPAEPSESVPPRAPGAGPEALALASELAAGIDDERLRTLVARAAAASLARSGAAGGDNRPV